MTEGRDLLSEQDTPAALRPPPLVQLRWAPWCRQWDRDISVPEQRTPLMTTASALTSPGQYHVSWWATRRVSVRRGSGSVLESQDLQ